MTGIRTEGHRARQPCTQHFDEQDDDEVREQLIKKLLRLKKRQEEEQLREGWSRAEESGLLIPPGWVRSPGSPPLEP